MDEVDETKHVHYYVSDVHTSVNELTSYTIRQLSRQVIHLSVLTITLQAGYRTSYQFLQQS